MLLTFDRRYDKWEDLRQTEARCECCMSDAPYEFCCKNSCGEYDHCDTCKAKCRNTKKLCAK